jgi:hypothetical protein
MKKINIILIFYVIGFSITNLHCYKTFRDSVGIEFIFEGAQIVTFGSDDYFSFNVQAFATEPGTRIGTGLLLINYNELGFGTFIFQNQNVEVIKGELITNAGPPLYNCIVNDNLNNRLAITFEYTSVAGYGNELLQEPLNLVIVRIKIQDSLQNAGLSFQEDLMTNQQYYDDNATKYDPVIATDIENSPLHTISIEDNQNITPIKYLFSYPNPVDLNKCLNNKLTNIEFNIMHESELVLAIYNCKGQKVRIIHKGRLDKGIYRFSWNGKDESDRLVSSGIYFIRLETTYSNNFEKILLLR